MSSLEALNQILLLLAKWWALATLTLFLVERSRNTSAATLHAILLFVLFALCCLPWLQSLSTAFVIKIVPERLAEIPLPSVFINASVLIYVSVAAAIWAKFLWQLYKLRRLSQGAGLTSSAQQLDLLQQLRKVVGIARPVRMISSERTHTPLTYGWLNPIIVLPSASQYWNANRLRRFLLHELAHVRRNDWLVKVIARTLVSVFWALPGAWAILRKIEWLAELACDDAVIRAEGTRAEYADDLLEMTACGQSGAGAMALIENYGHYNRIAAVLDGGRVRMSDPIKFWPYALVFGCLLLLLSMMRLESATPPPQSSVTLIPLVITGSTTDPAPPIQPLPSPSRPQKFLHLSTPTEVPHPQAEPVLADMEMEIEPFTMNKNFSPAIIETDITMRLIPVHTALPEYPKRALKKNIEGRVMAEFDILPDGSVQSVTIVSAEPARYFDQAVMAALKRYRYPPQSEVVTGATEVFEFKLLEDALSLPAAQQ